MVTYYRTPTKFFHNRTEFFKTEERKRARYGIYILSLNHGLTSIDNNLHFEVDAPYVEGRNVVGDDCLPEYRIGTVTIEKESFINPKMKRPLIHDKIKMYIKFAVPCKIDTKTITDVKPLLVHEAIAQLMKYHKSITKETYDKTFKFLTDVLNKLLK